MTKDNQTQTAFLEEAIQSSVTDFLAQLNGSVGPETEADLAKLLLQQYKEQWARQEATHILALEGAPDYSAQMKDAWQIHQEVKGRGPTNYLVRNLLPINSTAILVAATNSGGSTFQTHLGACVLTGSNVLGVFPTSAPDDAVVLWVNPEEAEEEPEERLKAMGLRKSEMQRFRHLHTRQMRLYLDQPHHVEAALDGLQGHGWLDGRPTFLVVDGFTPTLSGDAWNKDLEAWKQGANRLIAEVQPLATVVRAQVTSSSARYSKGRKEEGENLSAEDVIGGQLSQWPDIRLTINRVKGGGRKLSVRGRRPADEMTVPYDWDIKTWTPRATDFGQETKAIMLLTEAIEDHHQNGTPLPSSIRGLAGHLQEEAHAKDMEDPPSLDSFRRVITNSHWVWNDGLEQWADKSLEEVPE